MRNLLIEFSNQVDKNQSRIIIEKELKQAELELDRIYNTLTQLQPNEQAKELLRIYSEVHYSYISASDNLRYNQGFRDCLRLIFTFLMMPE
ncbi:MAG: hypothetical protein HPY74_19980 [Firmicutes bacterium]|nr:hypothetical protein [Bacillota bacterium]